MMTTHTLKLPCYMTDFRSRLRPTAFMDLAQQIGEDDAEAGGFGFSFLRERILPRLNGTMQYVQKLLQPS